MEDQSSAPEKPPHTNQVVINIDQLDQPKLKQFPNAEFQAPSRTKTLRRLQFSKPKSRFSELPYHLPPKSTKIHDFSEQYQPLSPHNNSSSTEDSDDEYRLETDDEDEDELSESSERKKRKLKKRVLIEWTLFLIIMTCLICSLTMKSLVHEIMWGLEIWKWCLMVLVTFCGRLVSEWFVYFLVFLIERNFMLREKILYFVYGLRKSFQNCAWLALNLVAWMIMFPNVQKHNKILMKVFRFLIGVLIAATIWLLKILFVKVLASSFHVATFFDRMKESVFHHYILDSLSGPPIDEAERDATAHAAQNRLHASKSLPGRLRNGTKAMSKRFGSKRKLDIDQLKKLSITKRATAWSVKRLVKYVRSSGLSTISRTIDDFGKAEEEINSEWDARNAAQRIFKHVAKPGTKYIEEEDLLKFLKQEEVHTIYPLFEGAMETGRITKSSFRNWLVQAYIERKALGHSLNDTKTAVQQLHKLASAIFSIIIIVVLLLVMGVATTRVILLVTSQLLLVGFVFQNTCKTIFESIVFVFVMHPFDVGDRCVIEGVQLIVEEMNILSTTFLRYDNEKIYYPNSILLTKPISNFRRSPEMCDAIDFTIDISTPIDIINGLKKAIQSYVESKPIYWSPVHSVVVKEIENADKMKMAVYVQHTMNHQNFGEKLNRRSELVLELKRIFETLGIKYHLLPQEIHLTQFSIPNGRI